MDVNFDMALSDNQGRYLVTEVLALRLGANLTVAKLDSVVLGVGDELNVLGVLVHMEGVVLHVVFTVLFIRQVNIIDNL